MRNVKILFIFLILGFVGLTKSVRAYEYPISELGDCRDQQECHFYCEIPSNHAACWSYRVYGTKDVLGEEAPEQNLKPLGITFPITELGGCANITACKAFCELTENKIACQTFSQTHRLINSESILEKAKLELNCTTKEECKAFCTQEVNHATCVAFARKYKLRQIIGDQLVEMAKTELGCTTRDECRALCAKPENRTKCEAFSHKFTPGDSRKEELIKEAKEKLGCTSFEDCKTFCQNEANRDTCRNFGQEVSGHLKEMLKNKAQEIGNCASNEECRKVCEEHPDKCPKFPKGQEASPSGTRFLNRGPGVLNRGREDEIKQGETFQGSKPGFVPKPGFPEKTSSGTNKTSETESKSNF